MPCGCQIVRGRGLHRDVKAALPVRSRDRYYPAWSDPSLEWSIINSRQSGFRPFETSAGALDIEWCLCSLDGLNCITIGSDSCRQSRISESFFCSPIRLGGHLQAATYSEPVPKGPCRRQEPPTTVHEPLGPVPIAPGRPRRLRNSGGRILEQDCLPAQENGSASRQTLDDTLRYNQSR